MTIFNNLYFVYILQSTAVEFK